MKSFKELVGERIKARRKTLQLTQEALAEMLGTDQSRVARWESGKNLPDPKQRPAILEALRCSEQSLFAVEFSAPAQPTQAAMAQTIALLQQELDALREAQSVSEFQPLFDNAAPVRRAVALYILDQTEERLSLAIKTLSEAIDYRHEVESMAKGFSKLASQSK